MYVLVCDLSDGMGTAEWRAAKSPAYYKRGDYVPGLKVSYCVLIWLDCVSVFVFVCHFGGRD